MKRFKDLEKESERLRKTVIESWRQRYNIGRPRSSLGYKPPTLAAGVPASSRAAEPTMH